MLLPKVDQWLLKQTADILDGVVCDQDLKRLCSRCRIDKKDGRSNRERIFHTLDTRQQRDGYSNHVISLIRACMNPVRFRRNPQQFARTQSKLNAVLTYAGLRLREDGTIWAVQTQQSNKMAEIRESAAEALRRLCGDEVEARLWKKLMRDKSYGRERFEADLLLNKFQQTTRPLLNAEHVKRIIILAAERQDDTFFKRLGKALSAKPSLPSIRRIIMQTRLLRPWATVGLDPLVAFLLTRWAVGFDELPPLCFLTPTSLTDVCRHYMGSEFSDYKITKLRQRLGLKQFKRHQITVIEIDGQLRVL